MLNKIDEQITAGKSDTPFMEIETDSEKKEKLNRLKEKFDKCPILIPSMYASALPTNVANIETSADAFHRIAALNNGEQVEPSVIRPDLIELFTLNNCPIRLVTSAAGFIDFPFYSKDLEKINIVSLEEVIMEISDSLASKGDSKPEWISDPDPGQAESGKIKLQDIEKEEDYE